MSPDLITYCSTPESVSLSILHGATHLILEDVRCAARSFAENTPHTITELAAKARQIAPSISLSVQMDILVHDAHFPLFDSVIREALSANITTFRVQDPGLFSLIKEYNQRASVILNTETSNNNLPSMQSYHEMGFTKQVLSNELPHKEISDIISKCDSDFELMIQGPLLIQYSKRRFMTHHYDRSEPMLIKEAVDTELPDRQFRFYDNPHGHFMYAHFDRCLIHHLNKLLPLALSGWIIDGRGESLDYLARSLTLYKDAAQTQSSNINEAALRSFMDTAKRPQKAGFFLANQTDFDWRSKKSEQQVNRIARVIDLIKPNQIIIETLTPFSNKTDFYFMTPEGKEINVSLANLKTLDRTPVTEAKTGDLLRLPWTKGLSQGSILIARS